MMPSGWTQAEQDLYTSYRQGEICDLSDRPEEERVVRDHVIEELLLHGPEAESGRVRKLRLVGARITGQLDLSHADIPVVIWLDNCDFEYGPHFGGACLRELSLEGSTMPSFWAARLQLSGSFFGMRMKVESGTFNLNGAKIGDRLDLAGASFNNPGDLAFDGNGMTVSREVAACTDAFDNRFTVNGMINFYGAHLGTVDMDGALLSNPDGETINGQRMIVDGHLRLAVDRNNDHFSSTGCIYLNSAKIGGTFELDGADLICPGGTSLDCEYLTVGTLLIRSRSGGRQLNSEGTIRLYGAEIRGNLELTGAVLKNPEGEALEGTLMRVGQSLFARADAENRAFSAEGVVRLLSASVGSHLDCSGALVKAPGRRALDLGEVRCETAWLYLDPAFEGEVVLERSNFNALRIGPGEWPDKATVSMDGLKYDRIPGLDTEDVKHWLKWIKKNSGGRFFPHAYEQLVGAYRRDGNDRAAQMVLRAKETHRHSNGRFFVRMWGKLQQYAVGYGYSPGLALFWLAVLLAAGTTYFRYHELTPIKPDEAPTWNPFVYTLDVIVPLLDFGHEHAFDPHGADQAVSLGLLGAGLVLAAAVIAGASRTLKRQ